MTLAGERADLLAEALLLVTDDRDATHGPAVEQHTTAARLWSVLLGVEISAADVIRCLIALKLSRLVNGAPARDHWLDIAGYAAIGWESEQPRKET